MRRTMWIAAIWLAACGDSAATVEPGVMAQAPERTAAQDAALRAMVMDVAEGQACRELRDRFVPLPEDAPGRARDALPVIDGRLWVSECAVERRGDALSIHLGGRGWQWVERSRGGPLGSSFTVRGTVPFEATADLEASVDVRYDERDRRAALLLTPRGTPRARVTPLGAVPVEPDGGWSSVIGGLGGIFGASPREQARPMLEEEAAAMVRRELGRGATLFVDLCTSQVDAALGAFADGEGPPARPFEDDGKPWLENARVRVNTGGIDLSGPWAPDGSPLGIEMAVESGPPVRVQVVCRAEAALVASSYLSGGEPRAGTVVTDETVSHEAELHVPADACDAPHLLVTPTSEDGATTYRVRIRRVNARAEPIAACD